MDTAKGQAAKGRKLIHSEVTLIILVLFIFSSFCITKNPNDLFLLSYLVQDMLNHQVIPIKYMEVNVRIFDDQPRNLAMTSTVE